MTPKNSDPDEKILSPAEHAQSTENEALQEEIRRRTAQLEMKEAGMLAQSRLLEAAEQKIRELVRSEGEADYKSRTLAAKLASTEKNLHQATQQRKTLERLLSKSQQDSEKLRFESQALSQQLQALQEAHQNRDQSTDKLEHKSRDLEAKLSRATSKMELYRGKLESLQRQLTDKDTEAVLHQQKLELAVKEQERLRKELEESRNAAKSHRAKGSELEESVFQKERRLLEAEESLERHKSLLEQFRAEREESRLEVSKLQSQLEEAGRQGEERTQQIDELYEQMQAIEQYHAEEMEAMQRELQARDQARLDLEEANQSLATESMQESEVLQRLRKERASLHAELETKQRQVSELSSWAERVRPAYETLKKKFAQLQGEYKQLHGSQADLLSQHRQQKAFIEVLQGKDQEKEREIARLGHEIEALKETVDLSQSDVGDKNRELLELHGQVKSLTHELEVVQQDLASSRQDKSEVEDELAQVASAVQEAETELEQMTQSLLEAEEALVAKAREFDLLLLQNQESKTTVARLQHELAQEQSQHGKAQNNLKELLRQRTQLLESRKSLEEQVGDLKGKEVALRGRLAEAEDERERMARAFDELQNEFESVNHNWIQRIKELQQEIDSQSARLEELQHQKQADAEAALAEKVVLESSLEELRAELVESTRAKESLESSVDGLAHELAESTALVMSLEETVAEQVARGAELEVALTVVEGERDELSRQYEATKENLERVQSELSRRLDDLKKLSENRKLLAEGLEQAIKQNAALKEALARSQKESGGLKEYLEKLQAMSKDRLEKAKLALEKRDDQLRKQIQANKDAREETARVARHLERSQLAESAYRGALQDLRLQLMSKDEMVEELEWHLGLVYQTLEEGQIDLDAREAEVGQLSEHLEATNDQLEESRQRARDLEQQLAQEKDEAQTLRSELEQKGQTLESLRQTVESTQTELERSQGQLSKTTVRLERLLSDLAEEQERAARLGAQLTDALQDRNKRVQRLRELQREFSEWREGTPAPEDDSAVQLDELTNELTASQSRELELQQALNELREKFSELVREKNALSLTISEPGDSDSAPSPPAGFHADQDFEVVTGVELGAQVLAAQMDLIQLHQRHESLTQMMAEVDSQDALRSLLVDLKNCEDDREHRAELFEILNTEWEQFLERLSEPSRQLLETLVGLVENEMKQARAAEARIEVLRKQLESTNSESPEAVHRLQEQLSEKTALVEELEEELVSVSAQLTEANDQLAQLESSEGDVSWQETKALRQELKEKSELLEQYRSERQSVYSPSESSLEDELENLNTRYKKGRRRISQLLAELEEKNRLLSELTGRSSPRLPAAVTDDEFELPLGELEDLPDLDADLDLEESFEQLPDLLKEDTVEDLPAIPYVEEVTADLEESSSRTDPNGSPPSIGDA